MAAGVFSLAAVVLICVGERRPGAGTERGCREPDPLAARDLVALMRTGEHGSWLAHYEFTRTLANGRVLRQSLSEARNGLTHVLVSGAAMTVERNGRVYDCNLVDDHASCHVSTRGRVLPASQVLRVAVAAGAYTVSRGPSTTIAGVRARCFRVLGTGRGLLPDLGTRTDSGPVREQLIVMFLDLAELDPSRRKIGRIARSRPYYPVLLRHRRANQRLRRVSSFLRRRRGNRDLAGYR